MCLKPLGGKTVHGKKYRFSINDNFHKSKFNLDKVQRYPVVDIFIQPSWCQASNSSLAKEQMLVVLLKVYPILCKHRIHYF